MLLRLFLLVLTCSLGSFTRSWSQAANQQIPTQANIQLRETGIWYGTYLKVRISDKLGYYGEHHYRTRNDLDRLTSFYGRPRQFYNRAGLNIFFNPYFEAVIGPTLVFNYSPQPGNPDFEQVTLEPRIWHQWLFTMPSMGRWKIFHQFRFEHRWKRENRKEATLEYTDRFRYKLFAYVPLNTQKLRQAAFTSPPAPKFSCMRAKASCLIPSKISVPTMASAMYTTSTSPFLRGICGPLVRKPAAFRIEPVTFFVSTYSSVWMPGPLKAAFRALT